MVIRPRLVWGPGDTTIIPALKQAVRSKRFAWIDAQLAGRQFLLGDSFSVADAYLFALTGWGQAAWLKSTFKADIHFDELGNLQAWYRRVRQRPAVQQALKTEGLE